MKEKENNINTFSVVAFIFSLLLFPVGLILSIIGIVKSKKYEKEYNEKPKNFVFNIIGLVISSFGLLISSIVIMVIFVSFFAVLSIQKSDIGEFTCSNRYNNLPAISAEFKDGKFIWSKYNSKDSNYIKGNYTVNSKTVTNDKYEYNIIIRPKDVKMTSYYANVNKKYNLTIKIYNPNNVTITFDDNGTTYRCQKVEDKNEF